MNYPPVSVIIPTYNRPDVLASNLLALGGHLGYEGTITVRVGDDFNSAPVTFPDDLNGVLEKRGWLWEYVYKPTGSLGANLNRLLHRSDDVILQLDDDHILQSPLDLTPHVTRLMQDERAGWIRLWLPECTCDGSQYYHFEATMKGAYWAIKPEGELYGPSNRPHLKHRRFHEHFGYYTPGLKLGQTEDDFCHRWQNVAREQGGPDVLIPVHLGNPHQWRHGEQVGAKSWQSEGL